MKTRDYPDVFGYTIFCDDIRKEYGEKLTLVGCYDGTIILHNPFPFTFPKFCFSISLIQRREILDPNIILRIFLPGDSEDGPSFEAVWGEPSKGFIAEQTAKHVEGLPRTDQRTVVAHAHIIATPLIIKQSGLITVRAARQGELIRLGGIRVVHVDDLPKPATS
jgi:hypothetical protein